MRILLKAPNSCLEFPLELELLPWLQVQRLPPRIFTRSNLQFTSAASSTTLDRVRPFAFVRRPVLIRSTRLERRASHVRAFEGLEAGTFSARTQTYKHNISRA